jgi:hypothetical protein
MIADIDANIIGVWIALATLAVAIGGSVIALAVQMGRDRNRLDTLWDMWIESARSKAVARGFLTQNSPLYLTDDARAAFAGMKAELQAWYKSRGQALEQDHKVHVRDLFDEIAKLFGQRIVKEVVPVLHLELDGCIAIAIEVAREGSTNG